MNVKKSILIFFISFLLVLSLVNAVQVTTQSVSNDLCPRGTGIFTHVIRNDNTDAREYSINLRGNAAVWATSVPTGVVLGPGEQKTLYTYVTPSQSAQPGNYDLQIDVNSATDSKSLTQNVKVKNCYSVGVVATPGTASVCPSEPTKYNVVVTNNGEYRENMHLTLSGEVASRISLSDNTLILDKSESKNVLLFANSPSDSGDYSFTLVVESESGRIRESLPIFLHVNACYDFAFTVGGNNTYSVCDRSYVEIPLNLKNLGTTLNSFKVSVDGPVWAKLEKDSFILKDREARSFNLMFAPGYGTAGEYGIRVTVTPEKGDRKAIADFGVTVRKCNSVAVNLLQDKVDACKNGNNTYGAVVTNDGELKKSYLIGLDAPEWVTLKESDKLLTLEAHQYKNFTISALPTNNVKAQNYAVTLKAVANDESAGFVKGEDQIILKVKNPDDCFKPSVETQYNNLVVYYDSSTALPIEIRNDGVRKADFVLSLSGNAATFARLNPSAVSVDPGKSEIVYLYVAPNTNVQLGSYDASIVLNLKDGPVLFTKNLNIEITDVRDRITNLNPNTNASNNQSLSFWSRVKSWFTKNNTNQTINNVSLSSTTLNSTNGTLVASNKNLKYQILGVILGVLVIVLILKILLGSSNNGSKIKKKRASKEAEDIKNKVDN